MVKRVVIVLIVVVLVVALVVLTAVRYGAGGARLSAEPADAVEGAGDALAALKPGMLVRHRDELLVVERTLHFVDGDERWVEHRLADDRRGRSLWLEIQRRDGLQIVVYERLPAGGDPPADDGHELARDGVTYALNERSSARYRSDERAGAGKHGWVEFVEYAAGGLRLAYERFDGGRWEVSLGHQVEPADLEVG
jgi:hypothetical protein